MIKMTVSFSEFSNGETRLDEMEDELIKFIEEQFDWYITIKSSFFGGMKWDFVNNQVSFEIKPV